MEALPFGGVHDPGRVGFVPHGLARLKIGNNHRRAGSEGGRRVSAGRPVYYFSRGRCRGVPAMSFKNSRGALAAAAAAFVGALGLLPAAAFAETVFITGANSG